MLCFGNTENKTKYFLRSLAVTNYAFMGQGSTIATATEDPLRQQERPGGLGLAYASRFPHPTIESLGNGS